MLHTRPCDAPYTHNAPTIHFDIPLLNIIHNIPSPIIIKYNHIYSDEWINLEIQFFKETLSSIIIKYKYTFYDEWIPSETHFPWKHFPQDTMPRTKSEDSRPKDKLLDGGMRVRTNKGQAAEKSNNTTHISTSQSSLPNEDKEQRLLSKRQAVVWRNESKDKQRTGHRKVGQYHTGLHLSVFMTR